MRTLLYLCIAGILLSMVAISPVIAGTTTATPQGNFFSSAILLHPEQGRFGGSAYSFTTERQVPSYSRFASFISPLTDQTRTYTEDDNGKTFAVTRGQVVKVRLNENPTTGYRWEPTVSSGIRVTDDSYAASTSGRMGAGGIHTWTLQITGTGSQHFNADYKRSWETRSDDNYSIQFVVE